MSQDTSATGGFLVPRWFAEGSPPPEDPPKWGERVEGVRMYASDEGDPDEYTDIRWGRTEDGRIIIAVDGDMGYSLVDLMDLLEWAKELEP